MKNVRVRVESPCTSNCCLNKDNVCMGCFRSVTEIMEWGPASDEERRNILLQAMRRRHYYHVQKIRKPNEECHTSP